MFADRMGKYDVKKKLIGKSDRVKCVDVHSVEPWVLGSLYSGQVYIWNYETRKLIKTFEASQSPVRAGKFVERMSWVVAGADDLQIRVFNYNTHEKTADFYGHSDYIRAIAIHPTKPLVLSGGDDFVINLWDWEAGWSCVRTFEGHGHYVMALCFNPRDSNTFASGSLDKTIKVWSLGTDTAHYTLSGHEKGVCSVDYYPGSDKPYLVSGGDDKQIKIWDYQSKKCVQTLVGHDHNVSSVYFHSFLGLILSGSEDEALKIWSLDNFTCQRSCLYGMDRIWCVSGQRHGNVVAFGSDGGVVVLQLGKDEPAISMDGTGKIIMAKNNQILSTTVRSKEHEVENGQRLSLSFKSLGQCEIFPIQLKHSANGRFVTAIGGGEYIVYTAIAWRSKAFGKGLDFAWSFDSTKFVVAESETRLQIHHNFSPAHAINESVGGVFGGHLIGVTRPGAVTFRSWEGQLVRRMEVDARCIYWSESGRSLAISTPKDGVFVLRYFEDQVHSHYQKGPETPVDGIENSFQVLYNLSEDLVSGLWIKDCFVFTTTMNKLLYSVGDQTCSISHLDRNMYILGYIPAQERIYLSDKDCNICCYPVSFSTIEYKICVLNDDMESARQLLGSIPSDEYESLSKFLQSLGHMKEALELSQDPETQFDLAIELGNLDLAFQLAQNSNFKAKWHCLGEKLVQNGDMDRGKLAFEHAQSYSDLMLLNYCTGDQEGLKRVAREARHHGQVSVSFFAAFLARDRHQCLASLMSAEKYVEATFFARTFLEEQLWEPFLQWKTHLKTRRPHVPMLCNPQIRAGSDVGSRHCLMDSFEPEEDFGPTE